MPLHIICVVKMSSVLVSHLRYLRHADITARGGCPAALGGRQQPICCVCTCALCQLLRAAAEQRICGYILTGSCCLSWQHSAQCELQAQAVQSRGSVSCSWRSQDVCFPVPAGCLIGQGGNCVPHPTPGETHVTFADRLSSQLLHLPPTVQAAHYHIALLSMHACGSAVGSSLPKKLPQAHSAPISGSIGSRAGSA